MSALSCGVAIGSTTVKVTFVDECGHAVWTKAVPTPRLSDGGSVTTDALGLVPAAAKRGWERYADFRRRSSVLA
jgi:hypothetical protein